MVGRLLSFWKSLFSGAMLVSGRVYISVMASLNSTWWLVFGSRILLFKGLVFSNSAAQTVISKTHKFHCGGYFSCWIFSGNFISSQLCWFPRECFPPRPKRETRKNWTDASSMAGSDESRSATRASGSILTFASTYRGRVGKPSFAGTGG